MLLLYFFQSHAKPYSRARPRYMQARGYEILRVLALRRARLELPCAR